MRSSSPYLAFRDWIYERYLSLCAVLAVAAMLMPLLVLHGVHTGVIERMRERLLKDPSVLVIMPAGTGGAGFTEDFFKKIARQPQTSFVIGRTRDVAAELQLSTAEGKKLNIVLEATDEGDPLLDRYKTAIPHVSPDNLQMVLSSSAALKLNIPTGSTVKATITRRLNTGKFQRKEMNINIVGILPKEAESRDAGFTGLDFLNAIQDYRDGINSPFLQENGNITPDKIRYFESFRAYVHTLEDVCILEQWFLSQNLHVKTRAHDIAAIQALDDTLYKVSLIIATATGLGFLSFMISSVYAAVRRKRKMLGMLRLIGFSGFALLMFPITQSLLTGALGSSLAFCLYGLVDFAVDSIFSTQTGGEEISYIYPLHFVFIFLFVELLAIAASLKSAFAASKIDPSLVIREL